MVLYGAAMFPQFESEWVKLGYRSLFLLIYIIVVWKLEFKTKRHA